MAKIKTVALSELERTELQKGCRDGATFGYRQRCQIILRKADCRTSKQVAKEVGCCEVVVNRWLNRYQEQGISGLVIRAGRGQDVGDAAFCKKKVTLRPCAVPCKRIGTRSAWPKRNLPKSWAKSFRF